MPIYEYICPQCGSVSEFLVGLGSADDDIKCKNCGATELQRVLSAAGFIMPTTNPASGRTCCGREERCESPPCSAGGACRRD